MKYYSIIDRTHNIELTEISLMGLVYECDYIRADLFDKISELEIGEVVQLGTSIITRTDDK